MFTRSAHIIAVSRRTLLTGLLAALSLAPVVAHGPDRDDDWHDDGRGAVFTLTNAPTGNAVLAYRRSADGSLRAAGVYPTRGLGTGASLSSQDAIVVIDDRRFLLAVNAGSNSISSFRIRHDGLQLVHTVASGGVMPTSLAARNGLVFVLNVGEPNNITGFRLTPQGRLRPIPGLGGPLSAPSTNPAQVSFSHDGDTVIVTERATNLITTYAIDDDRLDGPYFTPSAGPTPFGFAVAARNTVLVSEAGAGGGASTYRVRRDRLDVVSSNIMTGQRAACWAIITPNGRFGYVTNAGTGNISGFAIARDGSARLLNDDGVTAVTGGNPTDMAMSKDGRYLYARVGNSNTIAIFRVGREGKLTALRPLTGTPANLAGLAGF